jgi:predicted PurR-regulated permease PerM
MTDEPVPGPAADQDTDQDTDQDATTAGSPYGEPGPPLEHTPFYVGLLGGLGVAVAYWLATRFLDIGSVLILVVVAMFLAAGLNPIVEYFMSHGLKRPWALLVVIAGVLLAITLFIIAIVPVVTDQVTSITDNAPGWLDQLTHNRQFRDLDQQYDIVAKAKDYIQSGDLAKTVFGGALNVGLKVLSLLGNTFVVVVLTLYFLASLPTMKNALYQLAPASRRDRVGKLGDQIIRSVGGYVSGAFIIALLAGVSTLIFLAIIGLGEYAVALALVVAMLDVIPMIGATLGAIIVCAIAFATDPKMGIASVIFYVAYQQIENYVIYPRVMSRSVEIPGALTVIAALVGAALLGVVGALLAIPTAAAVLLIVREVWVKRQDAR